MSTRKKRTTSNSTRGPSSSLDEELNPSTLLTQGEQLSEPSPATAKATYEAEFAKLRKEAEKLAKAKKTLLAVQHEAETTKEFQKQKAKIAKLQEELRAIKAKQSLSFNQPSPEYTVPNQSNFTERNEFSPSPLHTPPSTVTLSSTLSSLVLRTKTFTPYTRGLGIPSPFCRKRFKSLLGHNLTGQFHSTDSLVNPTLDNS
jgi:hypothetical protein